jgi:hypothetical protein
MNSSNSNTVNHADEVRCGHCGGTGTVHYEEDGRAVHDTCYHCSGSGRIDSRLAFEDKVLKVASRMAYLKAKDYREYKNNDPEGEGFDFCAAERMMSSSDYFTMLCYDWKYEFGAKLEELPMKEQEEYVRKFEAGEKIDFLPSSEYSCMAS